MRTDLKIIRFKDLDIAGLAKLSEEEIEQLQGQKLQAILNMKYDKFCQTGKRRYKHTTIIDLEGCGMSMLNGRLRALVKRVLDVGSHYFPETAWKIYLINTPMVFRAGWAVIKPWLHRITGSIFDIVVEF